VTYIDSSVALAQLFVEDRRPPVSLWDESLTASRLLTYEVWNRVHSRRLDLVHEEMVRAMLDTVAFVELTPIVLARALEPFPRSVRTLDGLHLATIEFLRGQGQAVELASYDVRLVDGARALGIPIRAL
jgi:uncharacterized protein